MTAKGLFPILFSKSSNFSSRSHIHSECDDDAEVDTLMSESPNQLTIHSKLRPSSQADVQGFTNDLNV